MTDSNAMTSVHKSILEEKPRQKVRPVILKAIGRSADFLFEGFRKSKRSWNCGHGTQSIESVRKVIHFQQNLQKNKKTDEEKLYDVSSSVLFLDSPFFMFPLITQTAGSN